MDSTKQTSVAGQLQVNDSLRKAEKRVQDLEAHTKLMVQQRDNYQVELISLQKSHEDLKKSAMKPICDYSHGRKIPDLSSSSDTLKNIRSEGDRKITEQEVNKTVTAEDELKKKLEENSNVMKAVLDMVAEANAWNQESALPNSSDETPIHELEPTTGKEAKKLAVTVPNSVVPYRRCEGGSNKASGCVDSWYESWREDQNWDRGL